MHLLSPLWFQGRIAFLLNWTSTLRGMHFWSVGIRALVEVHVTPYEWKAFCRLDKFMESDSCVRAHACQKITMQNPAKIANPCDSNYFVQCVGIVWWSRLPFPVEQCFHSSTTQCGYVVIYDQKRRTFICFAICSANAFSLTYFAFAVSPIFKNQLDVDQIFHMFMLLAKANIQL